MKSILFVFILFSLYVLSADAESKDDLDFLLDEGDKFLQMEEYEEAISYFDKVLEIDPENTKAISKKAQALLKLDNPKEIISFFDLIVTNNPENADVLGSSFFNKVLEIDPNNIDALLYRGKSASIFFDRLEEANSYFDKVLEINPSHIDALYNKGDVAFQYDDFEKAILYFDKALDINPNHVNSLSGKGYSLAKMEMYDEAFSYLDKALEIDPNHPNSLYRKGSALLGQGNGDEALSYYYKSLKIDRENLAAKIKFHLLAATYSYQKLDGYVESKAYDSQGNLLAHLYMDDVKYLDHEIVLNMFDEWEVIKVVNRNGTDFEVQQHVKEYDIPKRSLFGGATYYGIFFPKNVKEQTPLIHAPYWQFHTEKGDKVLVIYTVFRPLE